MNLAASFVIGGRSCLLIDLSHSADASLALGVNVRSGLFSVSAVLGGQAMLRSVYVPTASGVDLVAGHPDTARFVNGLTRTLPLVRQHLNTMSDAFDFIVLDCSAQARQAEAMALAVADHVIITYCPGQAGGRRLPSLPRLQEAFVTGAVGVVANKVLPDWTAAHLGWQSDCDIPVRALGGVRYEADLAAMYWRGLPPVLTKPDSAFAEDMRSLVHCFKEC